MMTSPGGVIAGNHLPPCVILPGSTLQAILWTVVYFSGPKSYMSYVYYHNFKSNFVLIFIMNDIHSALADNFLFLCHDGLSFDNWHNVVRNSHNDIRYHLVNKM